MSQIYPQNYLSSEVDEVISITLSKEESIMWEFYILYAAKVLLEYKVSEVR